MKQYVFPLKWNTSFIYNADLASSYIIYALVFYLFFLMVGKTVLKLKDMNLGFKYNINKSTSLTKKLHKVIFLIKL